ncbi:MAG: 50S ribosomal protein L24 [Spirochaetes bacterium]|nr:50S ribosomal protein L24 [Spirochaetota bacterium]
MLKYKKIRKGDLVKVLSGKDIGKTGSVLKVERDKGRVLVEGVNLHKKSMRKTQKNQVGGIKDIESPLKISNVMIICPKCKKPTRISFLIKNDKKLRICKKCNGEI